ncbi:MAG TPA: hypothetical protein VF211_06105 [Burkholderiales bacterium]
MAELDYPVLDMREVYVSRDIFGLRLAERVRALAGQPVRLRGYMASPLAAQDDFFVLTRSPLVACPFCEPGTSWPQDVVPVQLERETPFVHEPLAVEAVGLLEVARRPDPRTGGLRLARLCDARWRVA